MICPVEDKIETFGYFGKNSRSPKFLPHVLLGVLDVVLVEVVVIVEAVVIIVVFVVVIGVVSGRTHEVLQLQCSHRLSGSVV